MVIRGSGLTGLKHRGWSAWHVAAAVAAVAACVWVTYATWADLLHLAWNDEESSHVLLVPLVVIWLVWVRRGRIRQCTPSGKAIGTFFMALGWFLWSFGYRRQIQSFWHAGAVILAMGGLLTVIGKDAFFNFLPAFAVLVFLVPVPATGRQFIAIPLQQMTALVTQRACEVIGLDVIRNGNLLTFNGMDVAVVEACNGMRMVFTLFLASYVFAFVTPLRGYVRFLILAACPVTAVVCNVIRLVPTVWMFGNYGKPETRHIAERFHDISGWVMLIVAFVGLLGIVRVLRWAMVPVTPFRLASN